MIQYHLNKETYCIYVYNTLTDHWVIRSPEQLKYRELDTLSELNSGKSREDFQLISIGKTKAMTILNEQYKDIEETWEYAGRTFGSGSNLITGDSSYFILYYQGNTYPVQYYVTSTDTYVLRSGKSERFSVSAKNCSPIYEILSDGTTVSYGKTFI